jgi:hypothetical protein
MTEGVTQGVECLPSKHKALHSNPNTAKKKKENSSLKKRNYGDSS